MAEVSMKKAVAWTAAAKYTTAALQLVFAAILSRLLTPEQFGTVAVIHVFVVFFQLFCDMGFGTAVIQDKELTEKQTNDIFSWMVYLGFALQILFIGASIPISRFYEDTIYIPLGIILSFSILLSTFNMIPNAIMLKRKQFKSITFRTIVSSVVASLLTIFLAFRGWGVYALVLQSLFTTLIVFIWNEITVRLKFYIKPEFSSIKRIWGYSLYQFLSQLLNYFNRNLDQLLIGKYFSKADLGQYNKSYHLMQLPLSYIPGVVGPALHPILSEHQNDKKYIFNANLRMVKVLSLMGCFISVWLYYNAEELVILLFGNQWYEAVLPFKILSLSVWFQMTINTVGPIYQSLGNTKLMFKSTVICSAMILAFIIAGCFLGSIIYVAICVSVAYFLNYLLGYYILTKYAFQESFWNFLSNFWQEVVIFVILMGVTFIPFHIESMIASFIVKSIIVGTLYAALLFVMGQHKHLLSLLPKRHNAK